MFFFDLYRYSSSVFPSAIPAEVGEGSRVTVVGFLDPSPESFGDATALGFERCDEAFAAVWTHFLSVPTLTTLLFRKGFVCHIAGAGFEPA